MNMWILESKEYYVMKLTKKVAMTQFINKQQQFIFVETYFFIKINIYMLN